MAEFSAEKRIVLAFGLSLLVLVTWGAYIRSKYPPPERPPVEVAATPPAPAETRPAPATEEEKAPLPLPGVKQGTAEQAITVETEVATIVLSTRGAQVQSWTLKDYDDETGGPLDLVLGRYTKLGYPLSFALADPQKEERLNNALFVVGTHEPEVAAPAELVFEWSDGRLAARKRFRFAQGYLCEIETSVLDEGRPVEHRVAWRGGFGDRGARNAQFQNQLLLRTPEKLRRHPAGQATQTTGWVFKSLPPFPYTGEAGYAGIEDRYFAAVFFPEDSSLTGTAASQQWTPEGEEKPQTVGSVAVGAAGGGVNRFRLFVGPEAIDVLEEVSVNGTVPGLADELVDFGFFWWVAKPIFLAMKWMYENWIPNYGWVIVLLTILINTALFPLKWKSMQSAWKMQKLAPQMKAIQARYKQYKFNDPRKQQMQQEIMALYKQHGVNPLGGCLPLLLQLPFFYGFYRALDTAIEMRHAPWVGWIQDLSQKDPYYVLPVVMGVTMYVSTKMTPMTTTDPAQQRLMQLFPLMFTFFFLQVSSGLVLYWMMSSLVGIAQQRWINNHQRQREAAEKLAAKERKKKKRRGPPDEG